MGILIHANSQSPLLISSITAMGMGACILLFGRPTLRINRTVIAVAFASYATGITFSFANQLTTVGNAIVLQYTSTIFVILYQALETHSMPSLRKILSVLFAFAGMGLFFFGDLSAAGMAGNVLAIVSGATFGLCFHLNTKPTASPMVSSLISCGFSLVPLLFLVGDLPGVAPFEWGLMLFHGLVCSGLASILYARGIALTPAFTANLICMSEILMAPLWSAIVFNECFTSMELAGAAVITAVIVWNLVGDAGQVFPASRETSETVG